VTEQHSPATGSQANQCRRRTILWASACALAAGLAGYAAGLQKQGQHLNSVEADKERLLQEVADLRERHYELRLEAARLESEQAVDAQALSEARSTIAGLEQRNAELESDLGFYRSIMAPSDAEKGFQVDSFGVRATGDGRVWDYSLVVTQVGNNDRFLSGRIEMTVIGRSEGETRTLALPELADDVEEGGIKYRFRYFQSVDGQLRLPEGFDPEQVRLQVNARSGGEPLLDETWKWSELLPVGQSNS